MAPKMLRLLTGIFVCAAFVVDIITGTSFTNPVGADFGTTYNIGQQINISWERAENFTALSLGLRQSSTSQIYWIIGSPDAISGYTASSYLWSIALGNGESLSLGNKFSFWLIDGGYYTQIYSPQFYLQDPSASTTKSTSSSLSTSQKSAATTSPQSMSMTVSTTASSSGSVAVSAAMSTNTANTVVDSSSTFSTGAKVGVAMGVVAAFALGIGLGLAYLLFRRRERTKVVGTVAPNIPGYDPNIEGKVYTPLNTDPYCYYAQQELPGSQPPAEIQYHSQSAHEVP